MPAVQVPGAAAATALGRTLVLAPHPDDETIGCGGLLALLMEAGADVRVVLLSDGAASHPRSQSHPPALLRALRRQEMTAALQELGCVAEQLLGLGLPDGAVPAPGAPGYSAAFHRLDGITRAFRPDSVVMPSCDDAHPDHRASHALGLAAMRHSARRARRLEYLVWPAPADRAQPANGRAHAAVWQVDIARVAGHKRRALAQHRSQLGQVVFDDPAGFTLPAALIAACEQPFETYHCFSPEDNHGRDARTSRSAELAAGLLR